jgi:hypothetical protein
VVAASSVVDAGACEVWTTTTSGIGVGCGVSVGSTAMGVAVLVGNSVIAVASATVVAAATGSGVLTELTGDSPTTGEPAGTAVSAACGAPASPQPDISAKSKASSKILFIVTHILYTTAHYAVPYRDTQWTPNSPWVFAYTLVRVSKQ